MISQKNFLRAMYCLDYCPESLVRGINRELANQLQHIFLIPFLNMKVIKMYALLTFTYIYIFDKFYILSCTSIFFLQSIIQINLFKKKSCSGLKKTCSTRFDKDKRYNLTDIDIFCSAWERRLVGEGIYIQVGAAFQGAG